MIQKKIKGSTIAKKKQIEDIVSKLFDKLPILEEGNAYHKRVKMLEYYSIKTLSDVKKAISFCNSVINKLLKSSNLNNKQQAELLLILKIEQYKIVATYIKSIQGDNNAL